MWTSNATKWLQRFSRSISTTTSTSSLPPCFLTEINKHLPELVINTNPYDLKSHGKGESYHPSQPPAAIVTPTCSGDISKILKLCQDHQVPIIPYGQGTSVEGHLCALNPQSLSLDLAQLKEINMDQVEDFQVMVGAGVTRLELNQALR